MKFDLQHLVGPTKEDEDFQMAPIIDCVFLLLIYFMLTTTLLKTEADLGIQLPGMVKQAVTVKMPDEQIIEINPDGAVLLNGLAFDTADSREMPQLTQTLTRFRQAADAAGVKAMITVQAADEAKHQRVVDVMNACAAAGITNVTFGVSG